MNVKNMDIKDIQPYKNNAKKHDETQINNVADKPCGTISVVEQI